MNDGSVRVCRASGGSVAFPYILSSLLALITCIGVLPICVAQEAPRPNPYKDVTDKLQSLTRLQLTGCRWHSDVAHPEDPKFDDSNWKPIELGASFESGVQDFRCRFKVPQT